MPLFEAAFFRLYKVPGSGCNDNLLIEESFNLLTKFLSVDWNGDT